MEFSEEEESAEEGGITIKNAAQYLSYKPPVKRGRFTNRVDESKYYEAIDKYACPNLDRGKGLKSHKQNLVTNFSKKWKENRNAFQSDF